MVMSAIAGDRDRLAPRRRVDQSADLRSRTDATDGQKRPTKGSYGQDRGAREHLEEHLKDEKRSFTALAQVLDC
jgi:hypothetical protein